MGLSIFLNYFYIFPKILDLFLNFEKNNFFFPLHFEAKIDDFISMAFLWFFNIIICFQIPIFTHISLYYNLINSYSDVYKKIYASASSVSRWNSFNSAKKKSLLELSKKYIQWIHSK